MGFNLTVTSLILAIIFHGYIFPVLLVYEMTTGARLSFSVSAITMVKSESALIHLELRYDFLTSEPCFTTEIIGRMRFVFQSSTLTL